MGLPASGRRARWTGTWTQRIEDGRISEGMSWGNWDAAGLMAQLNPHTPPAEYVLPGSAVFPEGVVVHPRRREYFVGSFTQGTIFRGHLDAPEAEVFLRGGEDDRTSALGLALDGEDRLYVAGGTTGQAFVYDTRNATLVRRFDNGLPKSTDPKSPKTFLNDLTTVPSGDVFLTDSLVPVLYRIRASDVVAGQPPGLLEPWLSFEGTPVVYQFGDDIVSSLNLNGIVSTPDGTLLVVVQTNTGKVFRIDVATREVVEVRGVSIPKGDGLVLDGQTLYGLRVDPEPILRFELSPDLLSGRPVPLPHQPRLAAPTTAALAEGRLLVVGSQFDKLFYGGEPTMPFTLSAVSVG